MRGLLQKRSARWAERVFVAEGAELLRTALRAGTAIESVYLAPEGAGDPATLETCDAGPAGGGPPLPSRSGRAGAGGRHGHAPAGADRPAHARRRRAPAPTAPAEPLVVVLVDVRDPGNAGTVLRTADAAGVSAVIFSGESVDPYNPKTVRASAGSLFHVPFSVQDDPVALAASLAGRGLPDLGHGGRGTGRTMPRSTGRCPRAVPGQRGGRPATAEVRGPSGGAVAIPMDGRAESLNVGVACAVLCFEALRQRRPARSRSTDRGIYHFD